jgi:hypothetical protein
MTHWIVSHWEIVSAIAYLVLAVSNSLTSHYSGQTGVLKVLTFITEIVSLFTSKDAPGWLKAPFTSVPPKSESSTPPNTLLWIVAIGAALTANSCCSTTRCYLARGLVAIESADKLAIPAISAICTPRIKACGQMPAEQCAAFTACTNAIKAYQVSMDTAGRSLATCNKTLADIGVQ